jgi:acetyltransferase
MWEFMASDKLESSKADKPIRAFLGQYPNWYSSEFQGNDGTLYTVRPIRPDDESLMVDFHGHLSEKTVYRRYFSPLRLNVRVAHERLLKLLKIDYHNEIALVATCGDKSGKEFLVAVGRLIRIPESTSAEVAFVVADQHQHHGLGSYLLHRIIHIARLEGFNSLEAEVLADNYNMQELFRRAGFRFLPPQQSEMKVRLELS